IVNDARGPILDLDALYELLRSEHIAGAGLDVLPQEPPVEPVPELLRAYRAREKWLEGRLVITPHSAWLTPHSWDDTRRKSAATRPAWSARPCCRRSARSTSCCAPARHARGRPPNWRWRATSTRRLSSTRMGSISSARVRCCAACASSTRAPVRCSWSAIIPG